MVNGEQIPNTYRAKIQNTRIMMPQMATFGYETVVNFT